MPKSSNSGLATFIKSILIPVIIATLLYLLIFHALLPLYRAHRARYAQYLPLAHTSSLTSRLPQSLQPSTLSERLSSLFLRVFLPSTWAIRQAQSSRPTRRFSNASTASSENLFSDESGEAMVGFDIHDQNRRRRDGMDRQVARNLQAAREMGMGESYDDHPERRLSRDLEEVFRDDSDGEEEEGDNAVTVGRRSMSASR